MEYIKGPKNIIADTLRDTLHFWQAGTKTK
jgi:hypothetical protein